MESFFWNAARINKLMLEKYSIIGIKKDHSFSWIGGCKNTRPSIPPISAVKKEVLSVTVSIRRGCPTIHCISKKDVSATVVYWYRINIFLRPSDSTISGKQNTC